MAVTAILGTGASLTFSGFTYPILSMDGPNVSRNVIEASKMATSTWHEFMPGSLRNPGQLSLEVEYDGEMALALWTTAQAVTVTYSNAAPLAGTGFLVEFTPSVPLEDKMTASAVIQMTGAVTTT